MSKTLRRLLGVGLMAVVAASALFGCGKKAEEGPREISYYDAEWAMSVATVAVADTDSSLAKLLNSMDGEWGRHAEYADLLRLYSMDHIGFAADYLSNASLDDTDCVTLDRELDRYITEFVDDSNKALADLEGTKENSFFLKSKLSKGLKSINKADNSHVPALHYYLELKNNRTGVLRSLDDSMMYLNDTEAEVQFMENAVDIAKQRLEDLEGELSVYKGLTGSSDALITDSSDAAMDELARNMINYQTFISTGEVPSDISIENMTDSFITGYEEDDKGEFVPLKEDVDYKLVTVKSGDLTEIRRFRFEKNGGGMDIFSLNIDGKERETILRNEQYVYVDADRNEFAEGDGIISCPVDTDDPKKGIYAADKNHARVLAGTSTPLGYEYFADYKDNDDFTTAIYKPKEGEKERIRYEHDDVGLKEIHEILCDATLASYKAFNRTQEGFGSKDAANMALVFWIDMVTGNGYKIESKGVTKNGNTFGYYCRYVKEKKSELTMYAPVKTKTYECSLYEYKKVADEVKANVTDYGVEENLYLKSADLVSEAKALQDTDEETYAILEENRSKLSAAIDNSLEKIASAKDEVEKLQQAYNESDSGRSYRLKGAEDNLAKAKERYILLGGDPDLVAPLTDTIPDEQVPLSGTPGEDEGDG